MHAIRVCMGFIALVVAIAMSCGWDRPLLAQTRTTAARVKDLESRFDELLLLHEYQAKRMDALDIQLQKATRLINSIDKRIEQRGPMHSVVDNAEIYAIRERLAEFETKQRNLIKDMAEARAASREKIQKEQFAKFKQNHGEGDLMKEFNERHSLISGQRADYGDVTQRPPTSFVEGMNWRINVVQQKVAGLSPSRAPEALAELNDVKRRLGRFQQQFGYAYVRGSKNRDASTGADLECFMIETMLKGLDYRISSSTDIWRPPKQVVRRE